MTDIRNDETGLTDRDGSSNAGTAGGFPAGARQTTVPSAFFSDVLPAISDDAELLVSLYVFYVLGRKRVGQRFLVDAELRGETPLIRAIGRLEGGAHMALQRGLDAAVSRGTLLRAARRNEGRDLYLYAVHAPGAAEMLARMGGAIVLPPDGESEGEPAAAISNIFVLYEDNVGIVSPLLADQLRGAEAEYPWPWIEAAFREAVALNRRNWRYIERILERWRTEGPDLEAIRRSVEGSRRRSLAGRYWRLVQH